MTVSTLARPLPARSPNRLAGLLQRRWTESIRWIEVIAACCFVLYTTYSVQCHRRLETSGYDLGIFESAVRGYAHGRLPVVELKGPGYVLLGDHFSPILVLLAPLYRVFSSPLTLLVVQSVLIAVSIIPIGRSATRVLGKTGGALVALGYGLSWGIAGAVIFDFHEIAFAVPLLAFCMNRLLAQRWVAAVAWAAPLVLVKEDLPFTVAAVGWYVLLRGQRRLGLLTMLGGTVTGVVIVKLVIPAFNPGGSYTYSDSVAPGLTGFDAKLHLITMLLVPTLFLAVRSPLLLIAGPTLAWRLLSAVPNHWSTYFHYSAVLMPIVVAAMLDVVPQTRSFLSRWPLLSRRWAHCVAVGYLAANLMIEPSDKLWRVADPNFWRADPAVAVSLRVLDRIPDGATVAATNRLAPQLTRRCAVRRLAELPLTDQTADFVVADRFDPNYLTTEALNRQVETAAAYGYRVLVDDGRIVLLARN